jgi:hypothetical protein
MGFFQRLFGARKTPSEGSATPPVAVPPRHVPVLPRTGQGSNQVQGSVGHIQLAFFAFVQEEDGQLLNFPYIVKLTVDRVSRLDWRVPSGEDIYYMWRGNFGKMPSDEEMLELVERAAKARGISLEGSSWVLFGFTNNSVVPDGRLLLCYT